MNDLLNMCAAGSVALTAFSKACTGFNERAGAVRKLRLGYTEVFDYLA